MTARKGKRPSFYGEKRKGKQLSGAAKMRLSGRKPVMLGLPVDTLETIRKAAAIEMRPVSQFITFHALQAARKVVDAAPGGVGRSSVDDERV